MLCKTLSPAQKQQGEKRRTEMSGGVEQERKKSDFKGKQRGEVCGSKGKE